MDSFAAGFGRRPAAFGAGHHLVPEPDVGEGSAHHHLVIASARAVRVEVLLATPCSMSHFPAGLDAGMLPAGEMWSVVIESPSSASARAPVTGLRRAAASSFPRSTAGS